MGITKLRVLFCLLLGGCQTVQAPADPTKIYKRDLQIKVNGLTGVGTLVVPKASSYAIEVQSRGRLDAFTITSCAREVVIKDIEESGGWFRKKKGKVSYTYTPSAVEEEFCQLDLGGYDKEHGRHSWAMIDFEDSSTNLPAILTCNGEVKSSKGVSLCDSHEGLYQSISFTNPNVEVRAEDKCAKPGADGRGNFTFRISRDVCYYVFVEPEGMKRIHRLTTIGYDDVFITTSED